jgi:hypothetical protein
VATILVENYVNRSYIDLLGREPVDEELNRDVAALRAGELGEEARRAFISMLQTSETFVEGDSSYKQAYYQRFYELVKARMLEGVSDGEIRSQRGIFAFDAERDSLNGDMVGYQRNQQEMQKLQDIIDSRQQYQRDEIPINEVFARALYNYFYDEINMNSINFIRACFNDLFLRFHTQAEFDQSFQIIEYGIASTIFGQSASNKEEYIEVLVNSREFYESQIRWAYRTLLARDPNAAETETLMQDFYSDNDFQKVQLAIMVTDEYANF